MFIKLIIKCFIIKISFTIQNFTYAHVKQMESFIKHYECYIFLPRLIYFNVTNQKNNLIEIYTRCLTRKFIFVFRIQDADPALFVPEFWKNQNLKRTKTRGNKYTDIFIT